MNGIEFFHWGTDYSTKGPKDGSAPFTGESIKKGWDKRGGNFLDFRPDFDKNTFYRFYHLSSQRPLGRYAEGDIIMVTGNTGEDRWGNPLPHHLHAEVWVNGQRIDPEKYDWNRTMKPKILIANIDHPETTDFAVKLHDKIIEFGGSDYEITEIKLKEPHFAPLNHYIDRGDGSFILDPAYLNVLVDRHNLSSTVIHFVHHVPQNTQWEMNHRPSAPPIPYKGMYLSSNWWWLKLMVPNAEGAWMWGALHEISHNLFQLLNDRGVVLKDTTHEDPSDYSDEYKTFKKYESIIGGVTPPETMLDFRKGDKKDNIYMIAKDGIARPFLEPKIYAVFAPFGTTTIIPQAQMDAIPKGQAIGLVEAD